MTYDEAKDQVAQEIHYKDWNHYRESKHEGWLSIDETLLARAAELYAKHCEKEGFEAGFKRGLKEGQTRI